jgi:hypothetical protein
MTRAVIVAADKQQSPARVSPAIHSIGKKKPAQRVDDL